MDRLKVEAKLHNMEIKGPSEDIVMPELTAEQKAAMASALETAQERVAQRYKRG